MGRTTLYSWIDGRTSPPLETARDFINALGDDPDIILRPLPSGGTSYILDERIGGKRYRVTLDAATRREAIEQYRKKLHELQGKVGDGSVPLPVEQLLSDDVHRTGIADATRVHARGATVAVWSHFGRILEKRCRFSIDAPGGGCGGSDHRTRKGHPT